MESATFVEQDAIVIGVSQDSPDMLKRFVNKHDLNFIVLSDEKREAFDVFGINTKLFGLLNSEFSRGVVDSIYAALY
jgi:peroxiredoxin